MADEEPPSAAAQKRLDQEEAKDALATAHARDFIRLSSVDAGKVAAQLGVPLKSISASRGSSVAFSNDYILRQITIFLTDDVVAGPWPG